FVVGRAGVAGCRGCAVTRIRSVPHDADLAGGQAGQHRDELVEIRVPVHGVPHGQPRRDAVDVAPAHLVALDVAGVDEVGHDALRRALGDADDVGDVAE